MLRKIDADKMGMSDLGWLHSKFHFSFAEYYNPANMHFGVLRVLNDDLIEVHSGFDTHPHRDMEIISYVVQGEITHRDSMGHSSTLQRGEVQYMSAGTGVFHSEHNLGKDMLRLLQIWIMPDHKGHKPAYGEFRFPWEARSNQWLHLVSPMAGSAGVKIHQDVNISALELDAGQSLKLDVAKGRQAYLVQIEGSSGLGGIALDARDALELVEESAELKAKTKSHYLAIEMALG